MKTVTLSAVLNPEDDGYVSLCPELDIASQGDTIEAALANLKEAGASGSTSRSIWDCFLCRASRKS